jgi:hypothetical protein
MVESAKICIPRKSQALFSSSFPSETNRSKQHQNDIMFAAIASACDTRRDNNDE